MNERRVFDREQIGISFIYSLDPVDTILEGSWDEAQTEDIGPVLVGGLAFLRDEPLEIGTEIRIALFMDMALKRSWEDHPTNFPALYYGTVCRVTEVQSNAPGDEEESGEFVSIADQNDAAKEESPEEQAVVVEESARPVMQYKIAVSFKGFEMFEEV